MDAYQVPTHIFTQPPSRNIITHLSIAQPNTLSPAVGPARSDDSQSRLQTPIPVIKPSTKPIYLAIKRHIPTPANNLRRCVSNVDWSRTFLIDYSFTQSILIVLLPIDS